MIIINQCNSYTGSVGSVGLKIGSYGRKGSSLTIGFSTFSIGSSVKFFVFLLRKLNIAFISLASAVPSPFASAAFTALASVTVPDTTRLASMMS